MFEKEHPNDGPSLKAWISDPIDKIRITSTPGGLTLTPEEARQLRDSLDAMITTLETGNGGDDA